MAMINTMFKGETYTFTPGSKLVRRLKDRHVIPGYDDGTQARWDARKEKRALQSLVSSADSGKKGGGL